MHIWLFDEQKQKESFVIKVMKQSEMLILYFCTSTVDSLIYNTIRRRRSFTTIILNTTKQNES